MLQKVRLGVLKKRRSIFIQTPKRFTWNAEAFFYFAFAYLIFAFAKYVTIYYIFIKTDGK